MCSKSRVQIYIFYPTRNSLYWLIFSKILYFFHLKGLWLKFHIWFSICRVSFLIRNRNSQMSIFIILNTDYQISHILDQISFTYLIKYSLHTWSNISHTWSNILHILDQIFFTYLIKYPSHTWPDKSLKVAVINQVYPS